MSSDNSNSTSLNKYISESGVCSRREADKIIDAQRVTINGIIAKKGNRVEDGDVVEIDGKPLQGKEEPIYLAFNKPPGITCTGDKDVEEISLISSITQNGFSMLDGLINIRKG